MSKNKLLEKDIKKMSRKDLNETLDKFQFRQGLCKAGSHRWNEYRREINALYIELGIRASG